LKIDNKIDVAFNPVSCLNYAVTPTSLQYQFILFFHQDFVLFLFFTLGDTEYSFLKIATKLFCGNRVSTMPSNSTYNSLLFSIGRWNNSNTLNNPRLVVSLPMICFNSSERHESKAILAATRVLYFISVSRGGLFSAFTPFGQKLFLKFTSIWFIKLMTKLRDYAISDLFFEDLSVINFLINADSMNIILNISNGQLCTWTSVNIPQLSPDWSKATHILLSSCLLCLRTLYEWFVATVLWFDVSATDFALSNQRFHPLTAT